MPSATLKPATTAELLALAAVSGARNALRASRRLGRLGVRISHPPMGAWQERRLPAIARLTVAIKQPQSIGVKLGYALFATETPAGAIRLARALERLSIVARVDQFEGRFDLGALIIATGDETAAEFIERYEPDVWLNVSRSTDHTRRALLEAAKAIA
jgi:hypothetical protein